MQQVSGIIADDPRMTVWMHRNDAFARVLHIAHHDWHGVRQATAYAPGHKLLIPSSERLSDAECQAVVQLIEKLGIRRVVFQAYSAIADRLLLRLKAMLGDEIKLYVVTHVTSAQFDHFFEMEMLALLLTRQRYGAITKIGSVKPRFGETFAEFWPHTIFNYAPSVSGDALAGEPAGEGKTSVYVPLDIGWRKNRYTNVLAALHTDGVDEVLVTNYPNGLESIFDLSRLRMVGYLKGLKLLSMMSECAVVLLATLAECQPMTQLEAMAVGTPALTGPLGMQEFADDELRKLCEVTAVDSPAMISDALKRLMDFVGSDRRAAKEMIADQLKRRHALADERYAEFLDL